MRIRWRRRQETTENVTSRHGISGPVRHAFSSASSPAALKVFCISFCFLFFSVVLRASPLVRVWFSFY